MTRFIVAGSHPLIRWALWRLGEEAGDLEPIAQAKSADEAVNLTNVLALHVVAVDCSMNDAQSWALVRRLRDVHPDLGIVALANDDSDETLIRALNSGASYLVSAAAPVPQVAAAIRAAATSRGAFTAPGLASALRRRSEATERNGLSGREQQVLELLRKGRSVPEVATTIHVSLSTAKTYVARIYEKLGASNRAQALMAAVGLGLFEDGLQDAG